MFRIVLVPVIACIYLFTDLPEAFGADVSGEHIAVSMTALLVLILFAIASFTDYLDGYIARKHNLITSFGKFIDPIADKLLVNTMFILFAVDGVVPAVFVLIMIWRDMIVDGLRMNASAKGKVVAAGMRLVRRIYRWICRELSGELSANSSLDDFWPTGPEVKSVRCPCLFIASSFIL